MNFGTPEIILIVVVLLLLFGATRLPQLAKSLGQSRKAFKDGMREAAEEEEKEKAELASAKTPPQVSAVSDPAIEDELRRGAEAKQTN